MKNINLIFDFDSTLLKFETIEILAEIALNKNKNKKTILKKINNITTLAMEGEIPFSIALQKRISLLNINKVHIKKTIDYLDMKLSSSFYNNLKSFEKYIDNCFVISGGFLEIILPILSPYGFKKKNVFANSFLYDDKGIAFIDKENDLSKNKGKKIVANNIQGYNIIIGDGYTDFELKKYKKVEKFILFTENVHRRKLDNKADFIAKNFDEVFKYVNNV